MTSLATSYNQRTPNLEVRWATSQTCGVKNSWIPFAPAYFISFLCLARAFFRNFYLQLAISFNSDLFIKQLGRICMIKKQWWRLEIWIQKLFQWRNRTKSLIFPMEMKHLVIKIRIILIYHLLWIYPIPQYHSHMSECDRTHNILDCCQVILFVVYSMPLGYYLTCIKGF